VALPFFGFSTFFLSRNIASHNTFRGHVFSGPLGIVDRKAITVRDRPWIGILNGGRGMFFGELFAMCNARDAIFTGLN